MKIDFISSHKKALVYFNKMVSFVHPSPNLRGERIDMKDWLFSKLLQNSSSNPTIRKKQDL